MFGALPGEHEQNTAAGDLRPAGVDTIHGPIRDMFITCPSHGWCPGFVHSSEPALKHNPQQSKAPLFRQGA